MSTQAFCRKMKDASQKRGSNIVLALDVVSEDSNTLLSRSVSILRAAAPYVCAIKVNRQLVLPLGLYHGVKKILLLAETLGLPTIMDCKVNDIGSTNREIVNHYYRAGFDAVTASPFVGWVDGLQPVFELAREKEKGVILLVYMSHRGAVEGYGQEVIDAETGRRRRFYQLFAEKALRWVADGVVVGATNPEIIREVRGLVMERVPIYSSGIGVQGGDLQSCVAAGTDYLIVGRSIVLADDPAKAAEDFKKIASVGLKR